MPAYEMHAVLLQLPTETDFYINKSTRNLFFAVRAIDEENNVGEVSNVALADFPITRKLVSTIDPNHTIDPNPCTTSNYLIHVIVIIVVSFVVVIAILIIYILYIRNKQKGEFV